VAALALALVGLAACVMPGASRPVTVKIIALNDYHGHLESPGSFAASADAPVSARQPVGGAEFIAAHVARLKATNPNNVVVLRRIALARCGARGLDVCSFIIFDWTSPTTIIGLIDGGVLRLRDTPRPARPWKRRLQRTPGRGIAARVTY
jgi:hypothetical protein